MSDEVRRMVRNVVEELVDDCAAVEVELVEATRCTVIEVRVAPADMARLLGRQGKIANALRTLLVAVGGRRRRTFSLEIIDPRNHPLVERPVERTVDAYGRISLDGQTFQLKGAMYPGDRVQVERLSGDQLKVVRRETGGELEAVRLAPSSHRRTAHTNEAT